MKFSTHIQITRKIEKKLKNIESTLYLSLDTLLSVLHILLYYYYVYIMRNMKMLIIRFFLCFLFYIFNITAHIKSRLSKNNILIGCMCNSPTMFLLYFTTTLCVETCNRLCVRLATFCTYAIAIPPYYTTTVLLFVFLSSSHSLSSITIIITHTTLYDSLYFYFHSVLKIQHYTINT